MAGEFDSYFLFYFFFNLGMRMTDLISENKFDAAFFEAAFKVDSSKPVNDFIKICTISRRSLADLKLFFFLRSCDTGGTGDISTHKTIVVVWIRCWTVTIISMMTMTTFIL